MRSVKSVMTICPRASVTIRLSVGRTLDLDPMKLSILVPAELISSRLMFLELSSFTVARLATWLLRGSRLTPKLLARTICLVAALTYRVSVLGTERPIVRNLIWKVFSYRALFLPIIRSGGPRCCLCSPVLRNVSASPELQTGTLGCLCNKNAMVLTRLLRLRARISVMMLLRWLCRQLKLGRTRLMFGRVLLGNSIL